MSSGTLTEPLRETVAVFEGESEPLGTNEVADRLELGRRSTYDRLSRLADDGWLKTKKVGASARIWWRSDRTDEPSPNGTIEVREGTTGGEPLEDTFEGSSPDRNRSTQSISGVIRGLDAGTDSVGSSQIDDHARYVRQEEVIASLGQRALEDRDLDGLMQNAVVAVAETLDQEFSKVLELDSSGTELQLRRGTGWDDGLVGSATVSATDDDTQAAYTLKTEEPVVVEDQADETRFCRPDLLRDHDVSSGISTIIGSTDDPWGILGTHDGEPSEYSERDVAFVQSVANVLANAIERHQYEEELLVQREQLTALDNLNTIVREITDAVIEQSTREEIETIVCDRLADSDSYLFAWIGDVDVHSKTVSLRTESGVEGYLDDITISVDPDDERSGGPTGRAILQREIQVTNDFETERTHDPWRDDVSGYGFRSSAAIPITHDDTLYGVLNVYAERPDAFTAEERTVISQLGEIVGHAIASVERKRALMSDEVVELEFRLQNLVDGLDLDVDPSGTVDLQQAVPIGDAEYLEYGTATGNGLGIVRAFVESDAYPHWESLTVLDTDDDHTRFEIRMTDPPVISIIASYGGDIRAATFEDGDYYMQVHLPTTVEVRQVVDAITDAYPTMEMVTQRNLTRGHQSEEPVRGALLEDLTDRQRATLEAAFHAGFFEWPRNTTGEDLAAAMGVGASTFHQHLRKAERKVLGAVLED